jgi:hypothetical protein
MTMTAKAVGATSLPEDIRAPDQQLLGRVLSFQEPALRESRLDGVLRLSAGLSHAEPSRPAPVPESLLELSLARLLEDEEEAESSPAARFLRGLHPSARRPLASFLREAAGRYVAATRYLFPLLYNFGLSLRQLSRNTGRRKVYVCLRDGISFLPALHALQDLSAPLTIRPLLFTRALKAAGLGPQALGDHGFEQCGPGSLDDGVLADAGFYGSLIDTLLEKGYCTPRAGRVWFSSGPATPSSPAT